MATHTLDKYARASLAPFKGSVPASSSEGSLGPEQSERALFQCQRVHGEYISKFMPAWRLSQAVSPPVPPNEALGLYETNERFSRLISTPKMNKHVPTWRLSQAACLPIGNSSEGSLGPIRNKTSALLVSPTRSKHVPAWRPSQAAYPPAPPKEAFSLHETSEPSFNF